MMFLATCVGYIVLLSVCGSTAQSYDNMITLLSKVVNGYNTDVRPVQDQSNTVKVNLSLILYNILDVDMVQGVITVAMGMSYTWHDERITWNSSEFGGISSIKLQQHHVWVPILVTGQSVAFTSAGQNWMHVIFQANGSASWNSGGIYKFSCPMNIRYWPFDEQVCQLTYFVYAYQDSEVLLQPGGLFTNYLLENGEWTLESTSIHIINRIGQRKIAFTIKLKRRVAFYTYTLFIPLFFLSFLSCFVFLLPSESGERVSYCITVLLSMTVFLDVISDEVPKLSNPVPILCQFIVFGVIMNAVVTILVVLNLLLYHRNDDVTVGNCYRLIVKLARCKKKYTAGVENREDKGDAPSRQCKLSKIIETCSDIVGGSVLTDTDIDRGDSNDDTLPVKISDKECDVTWQDVSIALDRLYFILIIVSSVVCIPIILLMTHLQL